MPLDLISQGKEQDYDKEKYREMLLEAAETVLGYFGFDRTLCGTSQNKMRKWWSSKRCRDRERFRMGRLKKR